MFHVPLLSVSILPVATVHNLVFPRTATQICGESDTLSIGCLKSIQFIAFEFKSGLSQIGAESFANYLSLRSICVPASVEFLGERSFSSCNPLSSLTFESGSKLTRIEANAFYCCSSLKSICLPASVEFLGERSFLSCDSLSSLTFESGSKLTRIEANALFCSPSLKAICLPASVEFLVRVHSLCAIHFRH
jgi:hypothetical protein